MLSGAVLDTGSGGGGNGPAIFPIGGISALPNSVTGAAFSVQLTGSLPNSPPPYTNWAMTDSSCDLLNSTAGVGPTLPTAFTLTSGGVLASSGVMSSTVANYYFYVTYVDGNSNPQAQYFSTYNGANPLKITTPMLLGIVTQGNVYGSGNPLATIQAAGNAGAVTWSLLSSTYGGLSYPFTTGAVNNTWAINPSTGAITGTATNAGINTILVQAFDGTNTITEVYSIEVYQYVENAPRPSYNPSSGTSGGVPCGPGFFVLNGQVYESNGTIYRNIGSSNAQYCDNSDHRMSTPAMNALSVNASRCFLNGPGGTGVTQANESSYVSFMITNWLGTHRMVNFVRWITWGGSWCSGSSHLGASVGTGTQTAGMGDILSQWVTQIGIYSPIMNNIWITIANEFGPYTSSWTSFQALYQAVQAPITGLNATTLTFSGTSPFNATNAGGGIGLVYILGATWSGANNDGLYAVTANGTNTLTGTFPSGYVSGGTCWAGAVGILRAAGYYCPLTIDAIGGQGYEVFTASGAAIMASDPLQSLVFSHHLYANSDNDLTQTNFENGTGSGGTANGILKALNTVRIATGAALVIDEIGVYNADAGIGGIGSGGDVTAFPSTQQMQSMMKYAIPAFHWALTNNGSPVKDSTFNNTTQPMRYVVDSTQSSTALVGHVSICTVFCKHTYLDPIRGMVANFTGLATSF